MEQLRQFIAGIGVAYTLIYAVLYVIGSRPALFAGIGLIAGYYALTTSQASNGLPWMVLWAVLHVGCRFVTNLLPAPNQQRPWVPRQRTPPVAVQAVIVSPTATPEACPEVSAMAERLPPPVRALIR